MTRQEMIDFLNGDAVFVGDVIGEIVDYIKHSEKVVYCRECKAFRPYPKPVEDFDGVCAFGIGTTGETDEDCYCIYGHPKEGEQDG